MIHQQTFQINNQQFPFNFIEKIYGHVYIGDIHISNLYEQLNKLDDKSKQFIELKFVKNQSYKKCSESLDVSIDRIHIIENKIIRLFNEPHISDQLYASLMKDFDMLIDNYKETETENNMLKSIIKKHQS